MSHVKPFDILDPATDLSKSLLLEASAGCGKTFAIENLVLRLIQEGVKLSEMVIVTFTKQGALDLKSRIRARLEKTSPHFIKDFDEAMITTIHGFGARLLQEDPLEAQGLFLTLKSDSDLYPCLIDFLETEQEFLSLEALESLFEAYPPHKCLTAYLKGPLVGFEETFRRFSLFLNKLKEEEEWFTYDDLLIRLARYLENKNVLEALRKRFCVGILDEFQDTDPLQWDIFQKLFLHDTGRLFLVGDPKQSIYAFRGAEIYTYLAAQEATGKTEPTHFNHQLALRSHPNPTTKHPV